VKGNWTNCKDLKIKKADEQEIHLPFVIYRLN